MSCRGQVAHKAGVVNITGEILDAADEKNKTYTSIKKPKPAQVWDGAPSLITIE